MILQHFVCTIFTKMLHMGGIFEERLIVVTTILTATYLPRKKHFSCKLIWFGLFLIFVEFEKFFQRSISDGFYLHFLCMAARLLKSHDFCPSSWPTTTAYTSTFLTIWVSIDFYFSRRVQKK